MILYRPVGLQELELIYNSGMKTFPARLPKQPIFYPVLELEYARQVASSWNAKSGQSAGYVTQFKIEDEYIDRFETHVVGGSQHEEYWIPAEEVEEFNRHIVGHIKVVEAHFGKGFQGFVPEKFALQGKNAVEQFTLLANTYIYNRMDFFLEIKRNHKAVFLNYPFWQVYDFKNPGLKEKIIQAIKEAWLATFPKNPLPLPPPAPESKPPVEQTDPYEPRLVDLDQEEINEVEPTEEEKSDQEQVPPVKQRDVHPEQRVRPVRPEVPPLKPSHPTPRKLVPPIREEHPPARPINIPEPLSETSVPEEGTPEEPADSRLLDEPADEQPELREQKISDSAGDAAYESVRYPGATNVPSRVDSVPEAARPVRGTGSHFLGNPVQASPRRLGQTDQGDFSRGVELGLSGRYQEAVEQLARAVEKDPDHVIARTSLGVAFHRLGEDDRALACYDVALGIDSQYAEAHYFRANILYTRGNTREGIAGYTTAIGLQPDLIDAHKGPLPDDRLTDFVPLPAGIHRIAKPASRILDLNQSLALDSRQANLFKERAAEYERLLNYEQAIADYTSSLALQPQDADTLHSRGAAYEQIGQHERARKDYRQALAFDPQLADVYIQRGVAFGQAGNLRQAIGSFTEGIRLAPENPDGYFNRGTAYFQQGDFARAIEDFSHVIRLAPGDEAAYYWRGIANEEAGRQAEALADYRKFLAVSRDPGARDEIEQKLGISKEETRNDRAYPGNREADQPKTEPVEAQASDRRIELYELLAALGEKALHSTWLARGVECYGESAEELLSLTDQEQPIEGEDFLRIASGIQQTRKGDFYAFDSGATSHWIFIRAWDGSGFYIETNDRGSRQRLKSQIRALEEVQGVSPPYQGFFIPV